MKSCIFATVLQSLLPFAAYFEGKTMQSQTPRGLCIRHIFYFPRVSRLLRIQARLLRAQYIYIYFYYYDLPRCRALRKPIKNVESKLVARQVVASSGNTSSKIKI